MELKAREEQLHAVSEWEMYVTSCLSLACITTMNLGHVDPHVSEASGAADTTQSRKWVDKVPWLNSQHETDR